MTSSLYSIVRSSRIARAIVATLVVFVGLAAFATPAAAAPPSFDKLRSFNVDFEGAHSYAPLLQGADGKLYGTTYLGGQDEEGTIFRMNADGSVFQTIYNFDNGAGTGTGKYPVGGLVQGSGNVLYGTTYEGGANGFGTIYKINPDGTGFEVLHDFAEATDGSNPTSGLVIGTEDEGGPVDYLYGTASNGGASDAGTVFKLRISDSEFTVIAALNFRPRGANPYGTLVLGRDGFLYGTAATGGSRGSGTVFRVNRLSGQMVVRSLSTTTSGSYPMAGLIQGRAPDTNLYGTTMSGGGSGGGTVFKIDTVGSGGTLPIIGVRNLSSVTGISGVGIMQSSDGSLYVTTEQGAGPGTILRMTTDFTTLVGIRDTFDYYNTGGYPAAPAIQGLDGALYGTTFEGGDHDGGTVYRIPIVPDPPTDPVATASAYDDEFG